MNLDTLDKSFLRLVTDFSVAKSELMTNSDRVYKDTIVISPNEIYTQISNSLTSIAFDDSYIVELVDCADNVMLDITDKIYINEFQDINGIYQIAFEIAPIGVDYYFKRLFLRFTHLDSDLVVWSNSFILTDSVQSIRLDYKNYAYYQGISYDRANIYQSIRIASYYNLPSIKENTNIYTQLNGDIRRSRTTQALEYNYIVEEIDTFTFDRLSVALNSDLVYINGVRFKTSENVQSDERLGLSNQFATSFKGQFEAKDTYTPVYQILAPFVSILYEPLGLYNLSSIPVDGVANFNYDLTSVSNLKIWNYDTDAFISDLIPSLSFQGFDFTLPILTEGAYYITYDAVSVLGQTLIITDKEVWKFSIENGHYNNTQYNNSQYFTD